MHLYFHIINSTIEFATVHDHYFSKNKSMKDNLNEVTHEAITEVK